MNESMAQRLRRGKYHGKVLVHRLALLLSSVPLHELEETFSGFGARVTVLIRSQEGECVQSRVLLDRLNKLETFLESRGRTLYAFDGLFPRGLTTVYYSEAGHAT